MKNLNKTAVQIFVIAHFNAENIIQIMLHLRDEYCKFLYSPAQCWYFILLFCFIYSAAQWFISQYDIPYIMLVFES